MGSHGWDIQNGSLGLSDAITGAHFDCMRFEVNYVNLWKLSAH